jgi:excisionase family DNA binding protein
VTIPAEIDLPDRLLRIDEAGSILALSRRSVYRLLAAGTLPSVRMDGVSAQRIRMSDVLALIAGENAVA